MDPWLLELLACPLADCAGRLSAGRLSGGTGVLRCRRCRAPYPVLGGVPVLLPDPALYVASYRDAVLASLAEAGRASRAAVSLVDDFAAAHPDAEPARFGDDWVAREVAGPGPSLIPEAPASLRALVAEARERPAHDRLLALAGPDDLGTAVEIGSGAGLLTRAIRSRARRVLAVDLSLRSVLTARGSARRGRSAEVAGAVADAAELPLRPGKVRTVLAANVVDLLDDPSAFIQSAAAALAPGGRMVLGTPDPSLGDPTADPSVLEELLGAAGLRVQAVEEGVAWLREHGPRHVEVYLVRLVAAERPGRPRGRQTKR